jgi:hypothetical protein
VCTRQSQGGVLFESNFCGRTKLNFVGMDYSWRPLYP